MTPKSDSGSRHNHKQISPCWSRDVARLHLQLSAAKLTKTSSSSSSRYKQVHVLFVTECLPIPNLFTCKHLVRHEGNLWLYKPESSTLQEKLQLPLGSCKLAIPFKAKAKKLPLERLEGCGVDEEELEEDDINQEKAARRRWHRLTTWSIEGYGIKMFLLNLILLLDPVWLLDLNKFFNDLF
ncbi:UDP-glucuronate:xylan alpha-glucuronosyltransferase 1 isoform X1 [Canna indica]|uniref:UDP-glucuronate:xylan alpha-glucuronosyltransferase 1 isoform X1 n=1 Tax=Canna indica TaxID=4628 RepID=A0AAQ3KXM9_9LILI|nr:UDP-glucuronate:xylan alpha-glucuronosyltransferase 1 isoform X1 [Canna indica]